MRNRGLRRWHRTGCAVTVWCALLAIAACEEEAPTEPEPPPFVPVPTTIAVTPSSALLALPGGTVQLTAVVRDQNGDEMEDVVVQWSSADTTVATVDTTGLVAAQGAGRAQVLAQTDTLEAWATIFAGDDVEQLVLTDFYHATGGPNWKENANWLSAESISDWHGVGVDLDGRVEVLRLGDNGLAGEIPPGIGELSALRWFIVRDNALTGPIPTTLARIKTLELLSVKGNQLTGPLPSDIGDATALLHVEFQDNSLQGLLPASMTNLAPRVFRYGGTELCAPRAAAFSRWLETVGRVQAQDCPPSRHDRLVLTQLYEAMGGSGWTRKDGWLSDASVSQWAGVTTDTNGRVTGLNLRNNGVTGSVPYELGYLRELVDLDISGNAGLEGMLQEWMTDLALKTLQFGDTGVCAPATERIATWLGRMNAWSGDECMGAESILVSVPVVYLTQPIQKQDGGVPMIAGRNALLRVFAVADSLNYLDSEARATFFMDGEAVHVANMTAGGRRGIPLEVDEGRLETSHHALIPGEVLEPGLEIVVEFDPDGRLPLRDGSQRRVPDSGRLAVDVRELPAMKVTVVPIQIEGEDTDLAAAASRLTLESLAFRHLRKMLPLGEVQFSVRETFHFSGDQRYLLRDVDLLRQADGDPGYYVGIVPASGVGYRPGRTSLADTTGVTIAHEIGHNINLMHAPCGGPQNPDPDYPYLAGRTGGWGYDFEKAAVVGPTTPDLMSYCRPPAWISDYHYVRAMEHRIAEETSTAAGWTGASRKTPTLLLWGTAGPDRVTLDPSIVLDAVPSVPEGGGPYRITGRSGGGGPLFSLSFTPMIEAESGEGHFVFLLPVDAAWAGSLASIILTGPNGSDRLDGTVRRPIAIVTDKVTGRIRKLLRDFETVPLAGPGEVVTVSWGLPDSEALGTRR